MANNSKKRRGRDFPRISPTAGCVKQLEPSENRPEIVWAPRCNARPLHETASWLQRSSRHALSDNERALQVPRGTIVDIAFGCGTRSSTSIDAPVELGGGVYLEPLDRSTLKMLLNACRLPRLDRGPLPPDGYAFMHAATEEDEWDSGERIWAALSCSRLVWRNVLSQEFAAQVTIGWRGAIEHIVPAQIHAPVVRAYLTGETSIGYPTMEQAALLRKILRSGAARRGRGGRVGTAMRRFSDAAFAHYSDLRMSALMASFEALVNTQRYKAKRQFVTRVAGMSRLCRGDRRYGRLWAARVYKVRNTLFHGRRLMHHRRAFKSEEAFNRSYLTLIADVEDCVRSILLAAYTDPSVLRLLQSPRAIAARWPV